MKISCREYDGRPGQDLRPFAILGLPPSSLHRHRHVSPSRGLYAAGEDLRVLRSSSAND
jgi:hypothetical protein